MKNYLGKDVKRILSSIKWKILSSFWSVTRVFHSPVVPKNSDGKRLLHLGCGPIDAPGFVNVDANVYPHVHHVVDAYPLALFPSNEFDLVYASHILEHYKRDVVPHVLKEWFRILKPGGILRLGVPNFETIVDIYQHTKNIDSVSGPLFGGQDYQHNFHYVAFDMSSLAKLCRQAGFSSIRQWDPARVDNHDFDDTTSNIWKIQEKSFLISLNLEAVK